MEVWYGYEKTGGPCGCGGIRKLHPRGGGAEPVYRSPQVSDNVIISMVEHGLGLSILSELVLRGRQDDVLAVPLDPPAVREIGVAMRSRKEMPLMVRRFLNEARDMIETL